MRQPISSEQPPSPLSRPPAPLRAGERWPRWARRLAVAAVALLPALVPWNGKYSDVAMYGAWANDLFAGRVPYRDFPLEYPPGTLPLFALPRALAGGGAGGYVVAFILTMAAFDLAQKRLLWLRCGPRRGLALALHSACGAALYFTYLKRFDVALACLMALGWDALWRAPRGIRTWALWGGGVLLKLIPVFLAPLWAWQAWRRGGSFARACAGVAAGLATVGAALGAVAAWAGPAAWSWLSYHQARGLQVGSTYTAVALLKNGLGRPMESAFIFGAAHLVGPWSEQAARLSTPLLAAAVALTSARMAPHMRTEASHWRAATAVLLAVLLTSKVYSPQFTAWILPFGVMAAVRGARIDWALSLGLLSVAGLTAEVFPGEFAMLNGMLHKQVAVVARAGVLLTLWGYLLATPAGLSWTAPGRRSRQ